MMRRSFIPRLVLVVLCGMFLSGCEMAVSSRMNTAKIEVRSKTQTYTLDAAKPDAAAVDRIASDFNRRGEGVLKLLVVYDPVCCLSMDAVRQGAALRDRLARAGVKQEAMSMGVMPSRDGSARGQAIVTYQALEAAVPGSCDSTEVPGSEGAVSEVNLYQYGCATADIMSRQVARPGDLLGRTAATEGTGRRQAAVTEVYNTGEPFEPLKGLQASGLGESE